MSMEYGQKPTSYNSQVVGMTKEIYDGMYETMIIPTKEKLDKMVKKGAMKRKDRDETINNMIKQLKLMSYVISKGVITHIREKAKVSVDVNTNVNTNVSTDVSTSFSGNYTGSCSGTSCQVSVSAEPSGTGTGTGVGTGVGIGERNGGAIE